MDVSRQIARLDIFGTRCVVIPRGTVILLAVVTTTSLHVDLCTIETLYLRVVDRRYSPFRNTTNRRPLRHSSVSQCWRLTPPSWYAEFESRKQTIISLHFNRVTTLTHFISRYQIMEGLPRHYDGSSRLHSSGVIVGFVQCHCGPFEETTMDPPPLPGGVQGSHAGYQ